MQRREIKQPKVKTRWKILLPLIALILLTIALMVKEFKDQQYLKDDLGMHSHSLMELVEVDINWLT